MTTGQSGGTEQVLIGLAAGLSRLGDGSERYSFLTFEGADEWLEPHVGGNVRLLRCPMPPPAPRPWWRRKLAEVPGVLRAYEKLLELFPPSVPRSDGTLERAGADVMHFAFQNGFLTDVPSIYHPHDLQHVHLPEFFDGKERARRELLYGTLCRRAEMVAVTSTWVKRDVVEHFRLPQDKVHVIPWASVVGSYEQPSQEDLRRIREKLALPGEFALFPAQTWPHKNHLGLVRAIARIRDRHGVVVPVVCSGRMTDHHRSIIEEATRLGIPAAMTFVGFVSPLELQALYRLARCVVIPTLFEAASFPLWEAFANGVPAACSDVTSLPEQAGDAALVFDPHDTAAMTDALFRLWTDDALRRTLAARGKERVSRFSWDRTARTFRAHYRRIARRPLTDEDRRLLAADSPL
jgi:glycosyltransferase involved in cell wall biosynthesis